jgi:hypothetical protein
MVRNSLICWLMILGVASGCPEGGSECHKHEDCGDCGTCVNGACVLPEEACGDGVDNDCDGQTDEDCQACQGMVCDDPPGDRCEDATTLRSFAAEGSCQDGLCEYPHTDKKCAHRCEQGECVSDPCQGVDCSTAPDACRGSPGECVEGVCVFPVVAVCGESDGCCPPGCGPNSDADCGSCDPGLFPCLEGCCAWQFEVVDDLGDVGHNVSLVLDADDSPHFSHHEGGGGGHSDVLYSRREGAGFQTEVVHASFHPGCTSLALDRQGRPHVGYGDWFYGGVYYASRNGDSWEPLVVETGHFGQYVSLVLDAGEVAHLAYFDDTNMHLRYAFFDGMGFDTQEVDGDGHVGRYLSMVLDDGDYPHIAYYAGINRYLKYARYDGLEWHFEILDDLGISNQTGTGHTSLKLDGEGNPHIAYYDCWGGALKYVRHTGSDWSMKLVDDEVNVGDYASLALDEAGNPHIAYFDVVEEDLKYAFYTSVEWEILVVAAEGDVGQYATLALDKAGGPHFGYYFDIGTSQGALHYAHR